MRTGYFEACADSEGPDQTAHLRSLIRTFAVRLMNYLTLKLILIKNKQKQNRSVLSDRMNVQAGFGIAMQAFATPKAHFLLTRPGYDPRFRYHIYI